MRSSKPDKRGRNKGQLAPFVALEHYLLNSAAWRDLTPLARACYVELASAFDGGNNGAIAFSTRAMAIELGVGKTTACRAVSELQTHGFVEIARHSSFTQKLKLSAEYRLAAFKCNVTGALPSKAFMRWQPKIQNTVPPAGPYGSTSGTVDKKRRRKQTEQFHQRNREGGFGGVHGSTSGPHLYSAIPCSPQTQSVEAQQGAAPEGASADASELDASTSTFEADTFVILASAALKGLQQLDRELPDELKSWAAHPSSSTLAREAA